MAKKTTRKKNKVIVPAVLLSYVVAVSIYFFIVNASVGNSVGWQLASATSALVALICIRYEKTKFGNKEFLWSIFFTALALGVVSPMVFEFVNLLSLSVFISVIASLALLCQDKYK